MFILNEYPQLKIVQDLAKKRKTSVYLVGGFLRDYLLKRNKCDFDFAVEKDALKFAQAFANEVKGAYVLLDDDCQCARVVKKKKGEPITFDFAAYRAKTFEEDLAHRDFTINTLSVDMLALKDDVELKDVIVDKKRALKDLKSKRIKRTSVKAFKEDPLRMLRAFSLKAMLDFRIELSTLNQVKKDKDLIKDVSYERIRDELFKIFDTGFSAKVLRQMEKTQLLETIIPQIKIMYDCKQGGYHHLDVWPHSMEALVQLEKLFVSLEKREDVRPYLNESLGGARNRKSLMKLAALLHDVGKPDTRKKEGERMSFHGHEHVGQKITRTVARMLKLSTKERHALEDMVRWHLRPGYLSNFKNPTQKAFFRYFRDTKDESLSVALLSLADQRATRGPLTSEDDQRHHEHICFQVIEKYFEKKKEKPFVRLINGDDVMKKFKLSESALIGKILKDVEEQQALGKITTKKEALEAVEKVIGDR